MRNNDTLIVMPHLDDETFLMGGYLTKFFNSPDSSKCTILTVCGYGRGENIAENGASRLAQIIANTKTFPNVKVKCLSYRDCTLETRDIPDIAEHVKNLLSKAKYKRVFIPSELDFHQDHKLVSQACKIALRSPEKHGVDEIYECPSVYSGLFHHDTPKSNSALKLSTRVHANKIRMAERYSNTEYVPDSVYEPYEYFDLIWKRF